MDPILAAILAMLALVSVALAARLRPANKGTCPVCRDEIHQGGYTHRRVQFCSEACAVKDWEFQAGW